MPDIETILTKPLDGDPIGTKRTFSEADYKELKRNGAVSEGSPAADPAAKPVADMIRSELEASAIVAVRSEMATASDDDLRMMIQRFRDKAAADVASLAKMKVDDLKSLATKEEIDLGDATKKDDIIAAIELAREAKVA